MAYKYILSAQRLGVSRPLRPCPPRSGGGPLGADPIDNRQNGCLTSAAGQPALGAKRRGVGCMKSPSFGGRRVGPLPAGQVLCVPASAPIYKASVERAFA